MIESKRSIKKEAIFFLLFDELVTVDVTEEFFVVEVGKVDDRRVAVVGCVLLVD